MTAVRGARPRWVFCFAWGETHRTFPLGAEATVGPSIADGIRVPRASAVAATALVRVVAAPGRWICRTQSRERVVTEGIPFSLGDGVATIVERRCIDAADVACGGSERPTGLAPLDGALRFALELARARHVVSPIVVLAPAWQRRELLDALVPSSAHASWIGTPGASRALIAAATAGTDRRIVLPTPELLGAAQIVAIQRLLRRAHEHTARFLFGADRIDDLTELGVTASNCIVVEAPLPEILRDSFGVAKARVLDDLAKRYLSAIESGSTVAAGSAAAGLHRSSYYRLVQRMVRRDASRGTERKQQ